jgi:predicted O-methyltransferase YrrM
MVGAYAGWLDEYQLADDNLRTWDALSMSSSGVFDLVLHDLGRWRLRVATLDQALDLVRPGGIALLDDVHKYEYRVVVHERLERRSHRSFSLRDSLRDGYGRYPYLVSTHV